MKGLFLIFLFTCGYIAAAQDSKAAQAFAGCYELRVEGWRSVITSSPPRRFQLTTRPAESGFEARDLDSKEHWNLQLTAWNVTDEGKVEIGWSTGFVGWGILLSKSGSNLRGTAHYFTDTDDPNKPSRPVTVVAHSVDCETLARRRFNWNSLWTPPFSLLWLVVLFLALLFAASRLQNKLLRIFFFWIPTLTVSVLFIAIVLLVAYLFIRFHMRW